MEDVRTEGVDFAWQALCNSVPARLRERLTGIILEEQLFHRLEVTNFKILGHDNAYARVSQSLQRVIPNGFELRLAEFPSDL